MAQQESVILTNDSDPYFHLVTTLPAPPFNPMASQPASPYLALGTSPIFIYLSLLSFNPLSLKLALAFNLSGPTVVNFASHFL